MRSLPPRRWNLLLLLVVAVSLACQVVPTPPPLRDTPRPPQTDAPAIPLSTATASPFGTPIGPTASATASPGDLTAFPYFPGEPFASLALPAWQTAASQAGAGPSLPATWAQVVNPEVAGGLTQQQRDRLAQKGFILLHSQEAEFSAIRQRVAARYGQPYYLTIDAASHALRLTLDELLVALEKEELRRRTLAVTQATLDEVLSYLKLAQGGTLEADTRLAAVYLGVGLRLLDPQAPVDPSIEEAVEAQVAQILAGRGVEEAVSIPGLRDDFSAYRPVGHYRGDPDLEAYFRAMTWYGRVEWWIETAESAPFASRVPLILTLALRRARIQDPALATAPEEVLTAAQEWARVKETISFLLGPDLDDGPAEYAALMDRVYGPGLTFVGLADESAFELFQLYARELPPVQPGVDPLASLAEAPGQRGWRFLGHGFRLDDYLLGQLASAKPAAQPTGTQPAGAQATETVSQLPSPGVDLFNLFGSPAALAEMDKNNPAGDRDVAPSLARIQERIAGFGQDAWLRSAPNAWLDALSAQVAEKDAAYPPAMRSSEWSYKDLNSALGAWAELRRGPRPAAASGGAQSTAPAEGAVSPPAPGYVEPNPEVFYRLSHLASTVADGLNQRDMTGVFTANRDPNGLNGLVLETLDLGDRLQRLGDIAARELDGQPPIKDDWAIIQAPLGPAEERATPWPQPPVGITVLESTNDRSANSRSMQVANGWIDRIYVLAPLEDGLYIAQGGVHSYYEIPIQRDGLLNDAAWRRSLNDPAAPAPLLSDALYLPEGNPVDVLVFRAGDVYRILPVAGRINLRAEPDRFSQAVRPLHPGDTFLILDGPVQAGGFTWWRVQVPTGSDQPVEGWLVGDPAWYERVW